VQLEDFYSPGRLGHKLGLVGTMAELVSHQQIVQVKIAQLAQLQLDGMCWLMQCFRVGSRLVLFYAYCSQL
jgi:hypothetical protein